MDKMRWKEERGCQIKIKLGRDVDNKYEWKRTINTEITIKNGILKVSK